MGVISISSANCKNCYRCVRYCPVKAISIKGNQARLEENRCIYCGICVSQCPQKAKRIESGLEEVNRYRDQGLQPALSLAPSFRVAYPDSWAELTAKLKGRGFGLVEETAVGAQVVAEQFRRMADLLPAGRCLITSPCSVAITYLEKYYPQLLTNLAPLASPMIAHGRLLKAKWGPELKVVFAGPCFAKKYEAKGAEVKGAIDAVITFDELSCLLAEPALPGAAQPDEPQPCFEAEGGRWFPLPGGLLRAAGLAEGVLERDILIVDGMEEMKEVLQALAAGAINPRLVELLACKGGCLGGPAISSNLAAYNRRSKLIASLSPYTHQDATASGYASLGRRFLAQPYRPVHPGEEKIRAILKSMGKESADKELNCGSCGYSSCRDKAVAIEQGMAELEMCLPYMREKAENMANLVIDFTPNAVLIVDSRLTILEFNPAAESMFQVKAEEVKGKPLRTVIDEIHFVEAFAGKDILRVKATYPHLNLITFQSLIYIHEEDLVLGVIMNITDLEQQKLALETVKQETIGKAQEVIEKQMRVAQEIAGLLGETTAESKVLLTKLIHLVKEGGNYNVIP